MYKKILKFLVFSLFLFGINSAFAVQTSLGVKCPVGQKSILLNGNNINNLANTNLKYLCFGRILNNFDLTIFNSVGLVDNTFSISMGYTTTPIYSPLSGIKSVVVDTSNFSYISISQVRYIPNAPDYKIWDTFNLIFDKTSSSIISIIPNVIPGIYSQGGFSYNIGFVPGFTFDNNNLYFLNKDSNTNSLNYIIPLNTSNFSYTGSNINILTTFKNTLITSYYYLDNNNKLIKKNSLNSDYTIFSYDTITNTIINSTLNTINTGSLIFNYIDADIQSYLMSEGFITYHRNNGSNTFINSYSGYLSYITTTSLKLLPQNIVSLADYDLNGKIKAYISGTGSSERIYYYINGELFFENDPTIIGNSTINFSTSVIGSSTGSTSVIGSLNNPSGFLSFSNTGSIYISSGCNVPLSSNWLLSIGGGSFLGFNIPSVSPFNSFGCLISTVSFFITPPTSGNILGIDKNNATYIATIASPNYSGFGNYKFGDILLFMALVSIFIGLFNYGLSSIKNVDYIRSDKFRSKVNK